MLETIGNVFKKIAVQALEYFERANDIYFFPDEDAESVWAKLDLTKPENWEKVYFKMRVEAYSGVGSGQTFKVDVGERYFRPVGYEVDANNINSPPSIREDDTASQEDEEDNDHEIESNWVAVQNGNVISEGEDEEDDDASTSMAGSAELEVEKISALYTPHQTM
jgi:hypothetical protein